MIPMFENFTPLEGRVWSGAMYWTHVRKSTLTLQALCFNLGLKVNRHTRRIFNQMVASGVLVKQKLLCPDSKYRTFYAAQFTQPMKVLI